MVQVIETNLEQINAKVSSMRTNLNKIDYLESAFKKEFSIEIKKSILKDLAELYEQERMFDRVAKTYSIKARFELTFKDKIDSYLLAADFYCKLGKIEDAEEMFSRASRESNEFQRKEIIVKRKEMYFRFAEYLEKIGKKSSSLKFYEKLLKMNLNEQEKEKAKEKVVRNYKILGKFKEAEIISKL